MAGPDFKRHLLAQPAGDWLEDSEDLYGKDIINSIEWIVAVENKLVGAMSTWVSWRTVLPATPTIN